MTVCELTKANANERGHRFSTKYVVRIFHLTDTIPSKDKSSDNNANGQQAEVIKVLPRARKQPIPIPVNLQIKPIILIRPKIIKPIIRVIH